MGKMLTYVSESWILTETESQWTFLKESVKKNFRPTIWQWKKDWMISIKKITNCQKPTITEIIRLHRLRWFEHIQRMEESRIPKESLGEASPLCIYKIMWDSFNMV